MPSQYNLGSLYANQYFSADVEGLKWLILAQRKAKEYTEDLQCRYVLTDPNGHISRLVQRMSAEKVKQAEKQADKGQSINGNEQSGDQNETGQNQSGT